MADGEIGEIVIRGENVMKSYWNQPDATADAMRGGWFHSGDLARRDGTVTTSSSIARRNDQPGGYNVYPREVEEILYARGGRAAVFGVPDAMYGEEVAALVTLKEGASATEVELRNYVKEQIAAYKYPRIIRFGPIPKGPTGKILKREIKFEP